MQQCPRCSQNVNPGARFCPHCAYDLTQAAQSSGYAETQVMQSSACPNCGAPVAPNAKFCPVCATPLGTGAGFAGGAGSSGGQNYPGPSGYQGGQGYGGYGGQPGYSDAGYSTPARKSSKMPLIIGAIVLVLLIGGGIAAYFLWFNKPADSTNSNSAAKTNTNTNTSDPLMSYSPGEALKRAYSAAEDGDETTFRKLVVQALQSDIPKVLAEMKDEVQRRGKATITITDEKITGDTAALRCEMKYASSPTRTMNQKMAKEGGIWKVSDF